MEAQSLCVGGVTPSRLGQDVKPQILRLISPTERWFAVENVITGLARCPRNMINIIIAIIYQSNLLSVIQLDKGVTNND